MDLIENECHKKYGNKKAIDGVTSFFNGCILEHDISDKRKVNKYNNIPKYIHPFAIKLKIFSNFDRMKLNEKDRDIEFIPAPNSEVIHPGIYCYQIVEKNKRIGNVTLLDIADDFGRKAILIDAFNIRLIGRYDYYKFLHDFIDVITGIIEEQDYCYLLIPPIGTIYSNQGALQRVFSCLSKGRPSIDNNFKMNPHDEAFNSLKENTLIILWAFSEDIQQRLFDE
ncbi:MAG TPA: hypothetical protein PLM53_13555 [Spirochaetota bacterium]|nr:hypothetical protein [Spirochaetota bacterium]HQH98121.1 hypothetical protein [Spirochaetota bacterium]